MRTIRTRTALSAGTAAALALGATLTAAAPPADRTRAAVHGTAPAAHGARWGRDGHRMVGLAAATALPADMPAFFRDARDQLGYLNYEPDRWRSDSMVVMNQAFQYDHFVDLEALPPGALEARSRFAYLEILTKSGIDRPENMGLLPFHIIELTDRLTLGFRLWRQTNDRWTRGWIEQRILNDAGILGHYVADAANPHHTTIHYNGWSAGAPNPDGFTTDRTFHSRFEADFVSAAVTLDELLVRAVAPAAELPDLRADVVAYILASHAQLRRLYELEKQQPFSATTSSQEHETFTIERLAAGARMLRSIWYTAWRRSV